MTKKLIISLVAICLAAYAHGEGRISASLRGGYPFSPSKGIMNGENSLGKPLRNSAAADIQYAFIFPQDSRLGALYPTAYQGIGVSVFSVFDHQDIGTPVSLYVFQGARIARLTPSLSLDYEWNFGASFGWHRNSEYPLNTITGTSSNAYINGSLLLTWRNLNGWEVAVGPDMTHYSNGHTYLPNAGMNSAGLRLNIAKRIGTHVQSGSPEISVTYPENISLDITAYGALKKYSLTYYNAEHVAEGRFGVAGIHINPFYDIRQYFRAGLSLDLNFDESANIDDHVAGTTQDNRIRFFRPLLNEQVSLGISARAELVMPIFSVQFGVGHNIIYKGNDLDGLYQIIALKTHITRRLYLHTGYQFRDFRNPDNLLIGFGWRFGNPGR